MITDNTTSLIVVLKGSVNLEKDGHIIRFGNGANLDTVRSLAAEKLSIAGGHSDIQLLNKKGEILTEIDAVRDQQVIFIDMKQQIKDVIPGPANLPFVGSLYELLPNM